MAVADAVPDRAQAAAKKFDVARVYDSHQALLADPDVDIVCVCTPSGLHADIAVDALGAAST